MTDLQRSFAEQYVIDYHITSAGKRAGIQGDNVKVVAWKMFQLPEVQEYIEKLQDAASIRAQISKDQWIAEWVKLGFSNIRNYMTDDCEVIPLSQVKDAEAIKSIKKTTTDGEFGSRTQIEFTLHDKPSALTNIGRHLGFYSEDNSQSKPSQIINFQPIVNTNSPPLSDNEK